MSRQTGQSSHLREGPVLVGGLNEYQRSKDCGEMAGNPSCRLVVRDKTAIPRAFPAGLIGEHCRVSDAETDTAAFDRIGGGTADLTRADPEAHAADVPALIQQAEDGGAALPIIAVSDGNDEGDRIAALEAGADDHVTRPAGVGGLPAGPCAARRDRLQQRRARPVFGWGDQKVQCVRVHIRPLHGKVGLAGRKPRHCTTQISMNHRTGARHSTVFLERAAPRRRCCPWTRAR